MERGRMGGLIQGEIERKVGRVGWLEGEAGREVG